MSCITSSLISPSMVWGEVACQDGKQLSVPQEPCRDRLTEARGKEKEKKRHICAIEYETSEIHEIPESLRG